MTSKELLLWFNMMFPLVFSIGPGNVMFASFGARFGVKKSLPFLFGFDSVTVLLALLIGYGGTQLMSEYATTFTYLKYAGAIYLIYLATLFFNASPYEEEDTASSTTSPTFINGAIVQALNVKSLIVISLIFTTFLGTQPDTIDSNKILILSGLLLVLALSCHLIWLYSGAWLAQQFASEKFNQIQNRVFSIMLVIVAIWILI